MHKKSEVKYQRNEIELVGDIENDYTELGESVCARVQPTHHAVSFFRSFVACLPRSPAHIKFNATHSFSSTVRGQ